MANLWTHTQAHILTEQSESLHFMGYYNRHTNSACIDYVFACFTYYQWTWCVYSVCLHTFCCANEGMRACVRFQERSLAYMHRLEIRSIFQHKIKVNVMLSLCRIHTHLANSHTHQKRSQLYKMAMWTFINCSMPKMFVYYIYVRNQFIQQIRFIVQQIRKCDLKIGRKWYTRVRIFSLSFSRYKIGHWMNLIFYHRISIDKSEILREIHRMHYAFALTCFCMKLQARQNKTSTL